MITLEGHLERVTCYNEENHYTVARLKTGKDQTPAAPTGRAARLLSEVTCKEASTINIALKNDRSGNRLSGLSNRLMNKGLMIVDL